MTPMTTARPTKVRTSVPPPPPTWAAWSVLTLPRFSGVRSPASANASETRTNMPTAAAHAAVASLEGFMWRTTPEESRPGYRRGGAELEELLDRAEQVVVGRRGRD